MGRSRGSGRAKADLHRITAGLIPWTYEGFQEAVDFLLKLAKTQPDDWDLSDMPSFQLHDDDTGETETLQFNVCHPTNQLARFFFGKYEDVDEAGSHFHRFQQIQDFLREHLQRLVEDELAELRDGDFVVKTTILRALCEVRYTGIARDHGERIPVLNYEHVVRRAAEFLEAEDEGQVLP